MDVRAQALEIPAPNEVVLRGQRWGEGPDWIILLHQAGESRDLDDWRPLLPAIMAPERTLLTVDLRGHGASGGEWDAAVLGEDIAALLTFAQIQGAAWVALAGAGETATQLLAFASSNHIDALVLLTPVFQPGQAHALRGQGEAKLFAVGSWVKSLNLDVREARNRSIGWSMLVSMPTEDQGAELLAGPYSSQLVERIVSFLAEQRMLAKHALPRRESTV
ncbi:MAG: alpha/beta hydrolase [Thermomicrobiales bacterium]|nr:alpha/beta hydrolase [Thermomicrobiales bacterium]